MRHKFAYKFLEFINSDTLALLKDYVVAQEYHASNDFEYGQVQLYNRIHPQEHSIVELFRHHLFKYFKFSGHIGTNLARMSPRAYVSEHSDYTANTYGSNQDNIIKLQMAIITTPGAGLMWPKTDDQPATSLNLLPGGIYIMDNVREHSSVNFSDEYRYWITSRWHLNSLINPGLLD